MGWKLVNSTVNTISEWKYNQIIKVLGNRQIHSGNLAIKDYCRKTATVNCYWSILHVLVGVNPDFLKAVSEWGYECSIRVILATADIYVFWTLLM